MARTTITINKAPKKRARAGASRSVTVITEPLVHTFDTDELAAGVAKEIRTEMEQILLNGRKKISPATEAFRESAERAYAAGAPWARARYDSEPNATNRIGLDSMRLARGVTTSPVAPGTVALLSPSDRTVAGPRSFSQSIPALRSKPRLLRRLLKAQRVKAALERSQDAILGSPRKR